MSVKPGLKGLTNEALAEIRAFVVNLLEKDETATLEIMTKCNRQFGTNDNQIRSLLIYMIRDGYVYLNAWGEYGLRGVDYKAIPVKAEPTEPFTVSVVRDDLQYVVFDDDEKDDNKRGNNERGDDWEDDGDDPFAWMRRWGRH